MIFARLDDADFRLFPKALLKDYVSKPVTRDVSMVLTLWPETITQNLINEFKVEAPIASFLGHWFSCVYKFILFFS